MALKKRKIRKSRKMYQLLLMVIFVIILCLLIYSVNNPKKRDIKDGGNNNTPTPQITAIETETPTPTVKSDPVISSNGLSSKYAYMVRLSDGKVLFDKESTSRMYPASMTKILTAVVAIENIEDLNKEIVLAPEMFNALWEEGASMAGFNPGESVSAIDLLYGVMLPSGADACIGLADYVAGSEEKFVAMMNDKIADLGLSNTHFSTATGLHDDQHYTTCRDMEKILEYALKNETFRTIFTTKSYTTKATPSHPDGITFSSSMIRKIGDRKLLIGEIEGGKTGFTDEAGLCLASVAKIEDEEYILITGGAQGGSRDQYSAVDALKIYSQITGNVYVEPQDNDNLSDAA